MCLQLLWQKLSQHVTSGLWLRVQPLIHVSAQRVNLSRAQLCSASTDISKLLDFIVLFFFCPPVLAVDVGVIVQTVKLWL